MDYDGITLNVRAQSCGKRGRGGDWGPLPLVVVHNLRDTLAETIQAQDHSDHVVHVAIMECHQR